MFQAFIGTSGFSYPHWGDGVFYPKGLPQRDWFSYYVRHFNSVELNVSFYRLPKAETFASWREKAGPPSASWRSGFVFSVKGSRFITHIKKLKDCREVVKTFFEAAEAVKNGKDIVLFQLPPRFKANFERLEEFLKILSHPRGEPPHNHSVRGRQAQHHLGGVKLGWRYAFEFRDGSWLEEKIYKLLREYNVAVVFQDFPGWPMTEEVTADFVYLRFHGRTRLYTSNYTRAELEAWAKKAKNWLKKGIDVYAYFNNDALGYAVDNAKQLKERLTS